MKPTTLYLYIFAFLALTLTVSTFYSDEESLLYTEEFDPEMAKFNERLDVAADAIQKQLDKAVEEYKIEKVDKNKKIRQNPKHKMNKNVSDDITQEEVDRLRRKISAKYFRDYGNFDTLNDGTFFSGMFTPQYQSDDSEI